MKTVILTLVSLLTTIASAKDLVSAQMLADVSSIAPGASFTVGVKLKIEPGWHVYWINPGDTGIPTRVSITAPQGFTVGEVQFPIPRKFDVTGGMIAYAYEDEVMLMAKVTAPKELKERSEVKLAAKTKWLACDPDQCIPGEGKSEVVLSVSSVKPQAANRAEFETWRGQLPKALDDVKELHAVQRVDDISPRGAAGEFKSAECAIELQFTGQQPETVEWFPAPPDQLLVKVGQIKPANEAAGPKWVVPFSVQALPGEKIEKPSIPSVMVYTVNGQRVGISMPFALRQPHGQ